VYEVYPDQTGLYRWRFQAASGEALAHSGRGYNTRAVACRAVEEFRSASPGETRGCEHQPSLLQVAR
jgi:uncharacterized protein YegP (UPF0339 family)